MIQKTILLAVLIVPNLVWGQSSQLRNMEGLYLSYPGAEYESTFAPCSSKRIWYVEDGGALNLLQNKYRSMPKSRCGEIFVVAKGRSTAVDRKKYPHSHYDGSFSISRLIHASSDRIKIAECRKRRAQNDR